LAVYLCATLPFIVIGGAVLNNGVWPFLRGLTIPAAMVLLLTTRSRTGILALLVFLLFYGLRILRTQSRKKTTIIVAILFVTLGALATAGIKTFHGHAQGLGDLFVLLFSSRTQAWAEAIQAFMKAPITGSGAGVNVYNIFLQILCQYGTIGLATFLLFIIAVFINYSQIRKANPSDPLYKGLAWSAIVLLIAGIGESFMGNQLGYYTLFIFFLVGFNTKGINMSVEVTPK
jgi:O-antigen ligase